MKLFYLIHIFFFLVGIVDSPIYCVKKTPPKLLTNDGEIDAAHCLDYTYDRRGGMIFQKYTFNFDSGQMDTNEFVWRCQKARCLEKCPVKLYLLGRTIVKIIGEHSHPAV
jgi:hypothetical protein